MKQKRVSKVYEKGKGFPKMWIGKCDRVQVWGQTAPSLKTLRLMSLLCKSQGTPWALPQQCIFMSPSGCQPPWRFLWWQEKPGFHSAWRNGAMAPSAHPLIHPWAEVTRAESDIKIPFAGWTGKCTSSCPWDTSGELLFPLLGSV